MVEFLVGEFWVFYVVLNFGSFVGLIVYLLVVELLFGIVE